MIRSHGVHALLAVGLAAYSGGDVDPDAPLATYEEREVLFVNPDDLRDWIEADHAEDVIFVDNRIQVAWEEQRIEGARLMPTDLVENSIGSLPVNKWLVMYCT